MAYLVGTDEAGYGPNLGPLVVGGTLWRVPDDVDGEELYRRLPNVLTPAQARNVKQAKLVIGDSKSLYKPGGGLAGLERGVFAALAAAERDKSDVVPNTWRALLARCDSACGDVLDTLPWYAVCQRSVPVDAQPDEISSAQQVLLHALTESKIELVAVRARVVFPPAFNERVQSCGSKGSALSLWTLELVEQMLQPIDEGAILIQCDKHGGRNRYAALLQHVFPDHLVEVLEETRQQSAYRWGAADRRIEARFIAKGERFLPSALASMFAKYLRELAMLAFNAFWQERIPGLKPTAGYPVDAKRFRQEIEAQQKQCGITDQMLWRER